MGLTMSNDKKAGGFEPHSEGAFAAVCCDVFEYVQENRGFGKPFPWKNENGEHEIDNRKTLTKIVISFLTTETIEINGETKPRYVSKFVNASWGEKSNCRKFVSGWIPEAGRSDTFNLDTLVGKTAMVQVEQYIKSNGYKGAGVTNAMALPKGMTAPEIPADFERHRDREAVANGRASASIEDPSEGAPF